MRYVMILLTALSLFFANHLFAENNIMFEKANQLYHNKNYDSASVLYQQMIQDGYCHPALYYNAGNAYYRTNQIGMAVWCFKKALLLDDNKNTRDNLQLAEKRIQEDIKPIEDIFFIRWWQQTYQLMTVNQWAITALIIFLITWVLLLLKNIVQKIRVSKQITSALVVLTWVCLLFLGVRYYQDTYHYKGIIIKPDTAFKTTSKSTSILLSEGITVEFIAHKKNQIKVKLPDGRIGEIEPSAFKKL
jgi:tetratricopeptide (TPR) repeat protein